MKKIVLTFGLVAGVVMSAMMLLTLPFHERIGQAAALFVGYATMVAAFLAIYFGVRRYRDDRPDGTIGFVRAFAVGMLIACVASVCYVATWEVVYFNFIPDYAEKYQARVLQEARASGASPEALAAKQAELQEFATRYHDPVYNSAVTFCEPLPVGLLVSLISAAMLRRRPNDAAVPELARAG